MTSDGRGGGGVRPNLILEVRGTNKTSDEGGRGGQKMAKII